MRRTYISPEFQYTNVNGTFNMLEQSSFFGSKMLEIEDNITISNQSIIYYQTSINEQIDISVESSLPSIVYNASDDKKTNHTIVMDESQPSYQVDNNTKWIIDISLNTVLSNYIFATLKQYRTFEGVRNNMTIGNDVNIAMTDYIKKNVLNRYKLNTIELYVLYNDLKNNDILRFKNNWNPNIVNTSNKLNRVQTETTFDDSSLKILFSQEKPSDSFSFDYFFNLLFEKI